VKGVGTMMFVNPYNFIPLAKKKPESKEWWKGRTAKDKEDSYQGVIEYTLETRSPLFIPNTSNDEIFNIPGADKDHKSFEFFSYDNLTGQKHERNQACEAWPVIPGSEIRGMLRSNFEILTNSCLSAVDDDAILSKRTSETFRAALLQKTGNSFELYKAEDCLLRTKGENSLAIEIDGWKDARDGRYQRKCYVQDSLKEGQKVYVSLKKRDKIKAKAVVQKICTEYTGASKVYSDDSSMYEGYLMKGEAGPKSNTKQNKHCAHVFVKSEAVPISMGNNRKGESENELLLFLAMESLDKVLTEYKNQGEHTYQEYANQYKSFLNQAQDGACFPVYYSMVCAFVDIEGKREKQDYYMLSPACITREIYQTRLKHFLGEHRTCTDPMNLCPACRLFGTLGQNFAVRSKVRFTDLTLSNEMKRETADSLYEKPVTLPPLSSPKLNNMEFYLKKPKDAWFWTYDYYIDSKGEMHPNQTGINGRKFYWHKMDVDLESVRFDKGRMDEAADKIYSKMNMTVRPLRGSRTSGVSFQGKLYFSKLSETELDQLIYLLETGDSESLEKKSHGYKLGAAKPLGFGSVALRVDQVKLLQYQVDSEAKTIRRESNPLYRQTDLKPGFDEEIEKEFLKMTDFNLLENLNGKPELSYPRVDGKEEIYEWFVWNHAGYRNKNGRKEFTGMLNARKQMVYRLYMEAMEPILQNTDSALMKILDGQQQDFRTNTKKKSSSNKDGVMGGYTTGQVTNICEDRGFGFAKSDTGEDVFFHFSVLDGEPSDYQVGAAVKFQTRKGEKGLKATKMFLL